MEIILILGPMYSGKTTRLIYEIERKLMEQKKCIIIRNIIDARIAPNIIKTHNGTVFDKCEVYMTKCLNNMNITNVDVIGLDESQFFDTDDILLFIKNC